MTATISHSQFPSYTRFSFVEACPFLVHSWLHVVNGSSGDLSFSTKTAAKTSKTKVRLFEGGKLIQDGREAKLVSQDHDRAHIAMMEEEKKTFDHV